MPTLSNMTRFELSMHREKLRKLLEERAPDLVAEMDLVDKLILAKKAGERNTYSSVSRPTEAIELCLSLAGDRKLTKKAIKKEILKAAI